MALRLASQRSSKVVHQVLARAKSSNAVLDSAKISDGSLVIVAGADSPASQQLLAEARARGAVTVGVISDGPSSAHKVEVLKRTAADIAVTESYCNTWYLKRLLSDLPKPALGVATDNGRQATVIAQLLAPGSTLVTVGQKLPANVAYGGEGRRPVTWADFLKGRKLKHSVL